MFLPFKKALQDNFAELSKQESLFYVDIDRDLIFETYLNGFEDPDVRQYHNCNCCKSFLRQWGGIVAIIDNKRVSVWDNLDVSDEYKQAVANLSGYIHSLPITDKFLNEHKNCGTDRNFSTKHEATFEHFFISLPAKFVVKRNIDTARGAVRTTREMLERGLNELTRDAVETVLDLIGQNSLYRGREFKAVLTAYNKLQKQWEKVADEDKENFLWLNATTLPTNVSRLRNTAIGTLLINLSEGMELDAAVTKYEAVVAPANYKRPTALVTPKMVKQAKEKLEELGLLGALHRRFANEADLSTSDILFTDKSAGVLDVFDEISKETLVNPRTLSKVDEITMTDFIENVVPNAHSIEVLLENRHLPNMVTLLTSKDVEEKPLFKWNNNFSWAYTGGVTDSIKERVKAAGGDVTGVLRCSLSWGNHDDLDIHVHEPGGNHIYFSSKTNRKTTGKLDVDMNAGGRMSREPVENVTWTNERSMEEGRYKVRVHNYSKRETDGQGYVVQIEYAGEVFDFEFPRNPANSRYSEYIEFDYSKKDGITFVGDVKSQVVSQEKWGVTTNSFQKVDKLLLSPNHWKKGVGNKHYFFMLKDCKSDEIPRPFFNEFLKKEFDENRKVFEIMGSKIKVESSDAQLSGVGFSETKRDSLIVKVGGKFERTLKVTI